MDKLKCTIYIVRLVNNQCTSSRCIFVSNLKDKLYLFPFCILSKNDYVSFENKAVNHDGKYFQTVECEDKIIRHGSSYCMYNIYYVYPNASRLLFRHGVDKRLYRVPSI